jgi:hypothetical protein
MLVWLGEKNLNSLLTVAPLKLVVCRIIYETAHDFFWLENKIL